MIGRRFSPVSKSLSLSSVRRLPLPAMSSALAPTVPNGTDGDAGCQLRRKMALKSRPHVRRHLPESPEAASELVNKRRLMSRSGPMCQFDPPPWRKAF